MRSKIENCTSLSTKSDLQSYVLGMISDLDTQFASGDSGIKVGQTCAHYDPSVAEMEGLSRVLWGLFPLLAGGATTSLDQKYIQAIRLGTDPKSEHYWGTAEAYDQRLVEMAVYGLGLALLNKKMMGWFSEQEINNLHIWLDQISDAEMPNSNWNYFAIMVQLGFKQAGLPWQVEKIAERFKKMDVYYLGGGWYSDGPGRPKDYYISMAFHYYGLIYAKLMGKDDPERSAVLRERATLFAHDFIHFSNQDGASIPFGRSLTYRFAMVAFWSAVAFSELDVYSHGVVKGIILRHLRWWQQQDILDRDGILTLGFAYPNLVMCEDYNAPGSPYWAFKTFLILALPDDHPFWLATEEELPSLPLIHVIEPAQQILCRSTFSLHTYLLTSGQLELNNYVNTEAKYTKFAYSSQFGFTLERGRYGIQHAACDSMLLFSEKDSYFRGRRNCEQVTVTNDFIYSRWCPWTNVQVDTWLIPCGAWHVRIHKVHSLRQLDCVEGGFSIPHDNSTLIDTTQQSVHLLHNDSQSTVIDASLKPRTGSHVVTPPNSNIMFAQCAIIPTLTCSIDIGTTTLISLVAAGSCLLPTPPALDVRDSNIIISSKETNKTLTLKI
ncbi:TPA: DUF2264 domain-containing protein [Vibrio parahaemolyticus]